MKVLITGVCGFVGSQLATQLKELIHGIEIFGLDNLIRPGSELNRSELRTLGVHLTHGDLRQRSDLETLPHCDFVIDAALIPASWPASTARAVRASFPNITWAARSTYSNIAAKRKPA